MNLDTPAAPAPVDIAQSLGEARSYWGTVRDRILRDKVTLIFGVILFLILLMAILAPWIAPADPYKTNIIRRLKEIGYPGHPLGTDQTGRDMLSRLIVGSRLSLFMGVTPVALALIIGGMLGIVAGYVNFLGAQLSLPGALALIIIMLLFRPSKLFNTRQIEQM